MKIFLIIFGAIIAYIFIGVLYYWTSILINYKKSKTKRPLNDWLQEYCDEGFICDTRENCYFGDAMLWAIMLPMYMVALSLYFICSLFSNIIKNILKINKLDDKSWKDLIMKLK